MKKAIPLLAALTAILLPLAVPANVLESLASNPDDVMLRKPAQGSRAEARRSDENAVAKKAAEEKAAEEVAAKKAAEEAAAKKAAEEAAAKKAAEEVAARQAAELKRLREEAAAARAAREEAEAARKAAEAQAESAKRAAEAARQEKAAAEKRAAYLANPDPDERPAAPRKKLQAAGDQKDVTETLPAEPAPGAKKGKKKLTGRSALITSDRTDYDRKEGVILFDRNVYVDDEQYQMHADRLFVFLDGTNDLKRLVAIGGISITNDTKAAGCQRAVYTKSESRIVLYGDEQHPAWLRDAGGKKGDASEVRGKRITYWFDSETATVEGAVVELPGIKGGTKDIFGAASGKSDRKSEKAE